MDLSFLPTEWLPVVHAVTGLIAACSVLALALKPLLGVPKPGDPAWKRFLFGLLSVIDVLAANTSRISTKKQLHVATKQLADADRAMRDARAKRLAMYPLDGEP